MQDRPGPVATTGLLRAELRHSMLRCAAWVVILSSTLREPVRARFVWYVHRRPAGDTARLEQKTQCLYFGLRAASNSLSPIEIIEM
ncbi:hypothetical protein Tdes44962_MAKER02417 [Teratosphaeria destructans]|uniref:Uncharacterized protein n=1 Tax=Teratosphaeria destructans TaxID=418781 RepID=A0A9W7STR9_9PEZI|nr:hypothetical protein Tdes44962_MAKER02417 [Teratosphaeria destructans]